jgi:hypothetical protein
MYLKHTDPAADLARKAFPDYAGTKFEVEITAGPMNLVSAWNEGGSRTYYRVIRLIDMAVIEVPENGSINASVAPIENIALPATGYAVVSQSIFCGKNHGLTIHVHPDNATPLLPAPKAELPWAQRVVLAATRSLKSSYAGISNYRQHEATARTGITRDEYDSAKVDLIAAGLLNKAGAITVDGKNVIGWTDLYTLKRDRASAGTAALPTSQTEALCTTDTAA